MILGGICITTKYVIVVASVKKACNHHVLVVTQLIRLSLCHKINFHVPRLVFFSQQYTDLISDLISGPCLAVPRPPPPLQRGLSRAFLSRMDGQIPVAFTTIVLKFGGKITCE